MIKRITILIPLLISGISATATEFAPIGSKWVRVSNFYKFLNQDIFESKEVVEIEGIKAKRIEHTAITYCVDPADNEKVKVDTVRTDVYAYNVGDSVYYKQKDDFVLLFVYNKNAGDTLNLQWVEGKNYKAVIKKEDLRENGTKRYTVSYMTPNNEWSPFGDAVFEDGFGVVGYELNGKLYDSAFDYPVYAMSTNQNDVKLVYLQNGNGGIEVLDESLYKQLAGASVIKQDDNVIYYDKKTDELVVDANYNKVELMSAKGELIKSNITGKISLNDVKQRILLAKIYLTNGSVVIKKIVR